MTDYDTQEDRGRKERSPSFPFISLEKAIDRAREVAGAHRRNAARLATVGETWGYSPSSSGLQQTIAALRAFGLLEDIGRGKDRRVQLTDLAWRIIMDTRPGAREQAIKEAALKPRLIAEFVEKWLPDRPSDNHCLSELQLDRGFTPAAAKLFLRVLDETMSFSNLKSYDNVSSYLTENGAIEERVPAEEAAPTSVRFARDRSAETNHQRGEKVSARGPVTTAARAEVAASAPRATLPLPEGVAAFEIPQGLSSRSHAALKAWVSLMVQLAEPPANALRDEEANEETE